MASSLPNLEESQKMYECPICLENVRWRLPMATKCGHVFCKKCIDMTLEKFGQKCPVCEQMFEGAPLSLSLLKIRPRERSRLVRKCTSNSTPVYTFPTEGRRPRTGIIKPTNNDVMNNSGPYKCPICEESLIQGKHVATACGHVFCEMCLETATECFICKNQISKEKLVRLYI